MHAAGHAPQGSVEPQGGAMSANPWEGKIKWTPPTPLEKAQEDWREWVVIFGDKEYTGNSTRDAERLDLLARIAQARKNQSP